MEEEIRNRKETANQEEEIETTQVIEEKHEEESKQVEEESIPADYDIENDPDYKWLFFGFKIIIVLLAYIAFQLCFDTFVRPLFISVDEKIGMIIASLQDQWCSEEGCTPEEQRTIQAIVKNIKESGKRFW